MIDSRHEQRSCNYIYYTTGKRTQVHRSISHITKDMKASVAFVILLAFTLLVLVHSAKVPCIRNRDANGKLQPAGCEERIVRCGTTPIRDGMKIVEANQDTWCWREKWRISLGEVCIYVPLVI